MKEVLEFKEGQSIIVNGAAGAVGNVLQTLLRLLVLMASIGCRPAG
jgi:NADPH-dependent curcumin reductase CurA